ncbi:MAG TPA: molybdopterin-dependent oxidoreductase [Anaerolineales bacterium]
MSEKISRRDFLKLASVGAATTAVLTGCGPASRYVQREPYTKMPEYYYNGLSTYYATTCRECAAGCGLIVRTMQGRALKVEGNANHPVNLGKTCPRGQTTLQGLYNPNRVRGPLKHKRGDALYDANFQNIEPNLSWDDAIQAVADALKDSAGVAFLMGTTSDHLFDLMSDLANAVGTPAPIRFGVGSMFEARATLSKAAEDLFGQAALPFFDIGKADLVLSFGANFLETWLSPVAYTREFAKMRRGNPKQRGYFIQFEARMSSTAAKADEWIPIRPGTDGLVALAIGRLVAEAKGGAVPQVFATVDLKSVASDADVKLETLRHIAQLVAQAQSPIAIPGGSALGLNNGLQTAEAVLTLNALTDNFGKAGGVFLSPLSPNEDGYHRSASMQEMADFIGKMKSGGIKTLFVHGVNPVFEIPKSLGFSEALANVGTVISFSVFADETAVASDYIFPDRHGLESWGYQRVATGTNQSVLSGLQPVVSGVYEKDTPKILYDARGTADVLIAAAKSVGDKAAQALPFNDEVEFIQSKLISLVGQPDGSFAAPEINSFSAYFQQYGGWWKNMDLISPPAAASVLGKSLQIAATEFAGEGEFFFKPFVSPTLGEAGANIPWLQELADPTTTVMWNTWVEINPKTAEELGIEDDDVLRIVSPAGKVEASVYRYPAIRPDTIAMPFGQGHTAYGIYAQGRGVNPADLVSPNFNEAGDLAFMGIKVKLEKTGKKHALSRLEGKLGVYGFTKEK